jgi:hypothetical protein
MKATATKTPLADLLDEAKVTVDDLAEILGRDDTTIYNKLAKRRGWKLSEVGKVLALLTKRLRRDVTFEMVEDFARVS